MYTTGHREIDRGRETERMKKKKKKTSSHFSCVLYTLYPTLETSTGRRTTIFGRTRRPPHLRSRRPGPEGRRSAVGCRRAPPLRLIGRQAYRPRRGRRWCRWSPRTWRSRGSSPGTSAPGRCCSVASREPPGRTPPLHRRSHPHPPLPPPPPSRPYLHLPPLGKDGEKFNQWEEW